MSSQPRLQSSRSGPSPDKTLFVSVHPIFLSLCCVCEGKAGLWHDTIISSFSPVSEPRPVSPGSTPVTWSWEFSLETSFNKEFILRLPAQQMFLFVLVYVYFNSTPNMPFIMSSGNTSRPARVGSVVKGKAWAALSCVIFRSLRWGWRTCWNTQLYAFFPGQHRVFPVLLTVSVLLSLPLQESLHLAVNHRAGPAAAPFKAHLLPNG